MTYKIKVKTIDNNFLTFTNVKEYSINDSMVSFVDTKTRLFKLFTSDRVDIEEER